MRRRSKAGSTKPQRRKAPAAKRRSGVETVRGAISSASKEELRSALLRRKLSEARRYQRHAEEALRESEHKLNQIIDTVPSFLWSADPSGEPTYVNQRTLDYSGMRFEEFKHGGWEAFIHPDDFPETIRAFRIALPDGTVKYIEGIIHHVISEEGELIELVGTNADVTERKRARDEHERLRQLEPDLAHMNRLSVMGFLHHENQRDGDGAIDLPVDHRC